MENTVLAANLPPFPKERFAAHNKHSSCYSTVALNATLKGIILHLDRISHQSLLFLECRVDLRHGSGNTVIEIASDRDVSRCQKEENPSVKEGSVWRIRIWNGSLQEKGYKEGSNNQRHAGNEGLDDRILFLLDFGCRQPSERLPSPHTAFREVR